MHFFQLNHLPFNVHYTFGNYISLQSSPTKKKKKLESRKKMSMFIFREEKLVIILQVVL